MSSPFYEDEAIRLEWEESSIPWIKLFTQEPYREMSDLPPELRQRIFRVKAGIRVAILPVFPDSR